MYLLVAIASLLSVLFSPPTPLTITHYPISRVVGAVCQADGITVSAVAHTQDVEVQVNSAEGVALYHKAFPRGGVLEINHEVSVACMGDSILLAFFDDPNNDWEKRVLRVALISYDYAGRTWQEKWLTSPTLVLFSKEAEPSASVGVASIDNGGKWLVAYAESPRIQPEFPVIYWGAVYDYYGNLETQKMIAHGVWYPYTTASPTAPKPFQSDPALRVAETVGGFALSFEAGQMIVKCDGDLVCGEPQEAPRENGFPLVSASSGSFSGAVSLFTFPGRAVRGIQVNAHGVDSVKSANLWPKATNAFCAPQDPWSATWYCLVVGNDPTHPQVWGLNRLLETRFLGEIGLDGKTPVGLMYNSGAGSEKRFGVLWTKGFEGGLDWFSNKFPPRNVYVPLVLQAPYLVQYGLDKGFAPIAGVENISLAKDFGTNYARDACGCQSNGATAGDATTLGQRGQLIFSRNCNQRIAVTGISLTKGDYIARFWVAVKGEGNRDTSWVEARTGRAWNPNEDYQGCKVADRSGDFVMIEVSMSAPETANDYFVMFKVGAVGEGNWTQATIRDLQIVRCGEVCGCTN